MVSSFCRTAKRPMPRESVSGGELGHEPKVSERGFGECGSGEVEPTRTSVREAKAEPEMCRQIPAQRRAVSPFGRTEYLPCFSKII